MRPTPTQTQLIVQNVRQHMAQQSGLLLSFSRVDDQFHGGDVVLYVESESPPSLMARLNRKRLLAEEPDLNVDLVKGIKTHRNGSTLTSKQHESLAACRVRLNECLIHGNNLSYV